MKTIVFCAIIIAASTFTMAVEEVYGWSKVRPHAEAAWNYASGLGAEWTGMAARADATNELRQEPGAVAAEAGQ